MRELTVSEVADRLDLSRSTVLRLVDDNEFDARRKTRGGPWFITEASVLDFEQDDDDDLDEIEQAHADGYKEGLAAAGADEEEDD